MKVKMSSGSMESRNGCGGFGIMSRWSMCLRSIFLVLLVLVLLPYRCHGADLIYSLDEEMPLGTPVGNIGEDYNLRDIMTGEEYANLAYQILASGNEFAHYFRVVNVTGQLFTTGPIDRDNIAHCVRTSECVISLGIGVATIGSFFRRIDVDISINDLNDNSPSFQKAVDSIQFYENSAEGASSSIAGAQDSDSGNNTVARYYVETPNVPFRAEMEKFVDGSSLVKIIVTGNLNREAQENYRIIIVAEDGGSPPLTGTVDVDIHVLDVNDNSPVFDRPFYNVTLNEDILVNTVFETISATDSDLGLDGEVHYKLSPFNTDAIKNLFSINSTTGDLSVIGQLVYIPNEQPIIYVDAFDSGEQPRSSRIVVYVNIVDSSNNPPTINLNILHVDNNGNARISEYANLGAFVAHIAVTDGDSGRNGNVDCTAVSDSFRLERYENRQYKAVVSKALDREVKASHDVQIVCKDSGSPPLNSTVNFTVVIVDENDNIPRFTQSIYYPKIEENNDVGAVVTKVSATDIDSGENALIKYSLISTAGYHFWIDPANGEVRANFILDRENITHVTLLVRAEDKGTPSLSATSTIILSILDQNDNFPIFSQPNYEFFVYENLPYNTSVDQLTATDIDNGENRTIVFSFGEQVPSNFPFTLYSDGNIKVIRSLDREVQSVYEFTVAAADQGRPPQSSSVTVTVNVLDQNDNGPVFDFPDDDNNTASIPLSSSPDDVSIMIKARDKDDGANGEVSYALLDTNVSSLFYMEVADGHGQIRIHRHPQSSEALKYTLRIKAEDNGSPKQYTIKTLNVSFTKVVPPESQTNLFIAIALGCITVVLSIAIVLTIYIIRRNDRRRQKSGVVFSDKADLQIVPSDTKQVHIAELASTSSGSKDSLKKVSFSTDHNSSLESEVHRDVAQAPLVRLDSNKISENGRVPPNATSSPRSFSQSSSQHDDEMQRLDPATVLQIHRSLLQSHDQLWANHREGHTPPLTKDILSEQDDNGSESSGETATYDSGRGGSESDIQTSMSQSHDNDHIKTVTFANKAKLHHIPLDNRWQDVRDYPYNTHRPYSPNCVANPNFPTPYRPVLPTRDYVTSPKSPSHPHHPSQHPLQQYQNLPTNKLAPINDTASHMTSYDDDDDTTTSGSYTIDNDHDWMSDSQPQSPRPYFLSHNEAYC